MQIVINLEDEIYEDIKYRYDKNQLTLGAMVLELAILHGEILPKGHGRLIEEPTETDISNTVGGNNDFAECIRDSVKAVFDNATTIVEADKESDND